MGNFFFNYQSCTFYNHLSFQCVLYICILYMYNSNRDILPGVNACLVTVKRKKKKKAVQLSVMISLLSALCSFKTLTGRCDALLHTVDLWGLLGSMSKGFLLHYTCCDLIMLISCVALGCVDDVEDCIVSLMPTDLLSVSLDQSLLHFSHVHRCFLWCETGWESYCCTSHGQFLILWLCYA